MNENPQRPQMTTADSSSHPSHPPHNAHVILVVDDALDSLRMLCDALAAEGYVVLAARDADEALQRFALTVPDGVLLEPSCPAWTASRCAARSRPRRPGPMCPWCS